MNLSHHHTTNHHRPSIISRSNELQILDSNPLRLTMTVTVMQIGSLLAMVVDSGRKTLI